MPTRRRFCLDSVTLLAAAPLRGLYAQPTPPADPTRPDVASIDHDRILAAAQRALADKPTPITSITAPNSPGTPQDFFSQPEPDTDTGAAAAFTAHRDALFALGLRVPALAAASLITSDPRYAAAAAPHLRAWFVDPATRMTPRLEFAHTPLAARPPAAPIDAPSTPPPAPAATADTKPSQAPASNEPTGTYTGLIEALPLVEILQSIPFLTAFNALTDADLSGLRDWFSQYLQWLTKTEDSGPRIAALARDSKDHHATSWMLQAIACTLFVTPTNGAPRGEDHNSTELRRRFRSVVLRSQISPEGQFRHDLSGPNPYRDSLFNLDMMAALCLLLSTRFESAWDYQLEDGPSMRGAMAFHVPFIANRAHWPYRADAHHFSELPSRRPSLLLAAHPYGRPEYASLWRTLTPDPPSPEIQRSIALHQPILWTRTPPRPRSND